MNRSMIYVQYSDGSKPKGTRVTLGFSGFFGGVTKDFFTDRDGLAIVEHASTGKATVYVSGSDKGSFNAPGTFVATI